MSETWMVVRSSRDPDQIARMLSKDGKNQIIWRGNKRPMLLKLCPYFEYMPWWYYSRDRRFHEKWNRWIWRRGSDADITPPVIPPRKPPDDIPPFLPPDDDGISSYLPRQPADLKPSDNVPGTRTTWEEAVRNYGERLRDWTVRVDQKLDKMANAPKNYFGADPPRTPEQMKADNEHIKEYLEKRSDEDARLFLPKSSSPALAKTPDEIKNLLKIIPIDTHQVASGKQGNQMILEAILIGHSS